ncbi:MAG TPA: arginase family protein, partial [Bacteroidales bacterium]|nr:arginase family protein [Bacteroidales bacterium]
MIDLNQYFDPVCLDRPEIAHIRGAAGFSHNIYVNTGNEPIGDISGFTAAFIGVPDDRASMNTGAAHAPDTIRKNLYSFSRLPGKMKIADLGNLRPGTAFEDTLAGLRDVLSLLLDHEIVPIILG